MLIIPAIDLIEGSCVRLTEGNYNLKKKYSDDPVAIARKWEKSGAKWLHIVDLDGAKTGSMENLEIAADIKNKTGLRIQYGGGVRSIDRLELVLNRGIDRAILGTSAIENKEFFKKAVESAGKRCILSIDFDSNGVIYKQGWQKDTDLNVFSFLPELKEFNIKEIIITNISRDGTLKGLDMELINRILSISPIKLIIAGGISSDKDIIELKALENKGIGGIIIGKALYEGRIDLRNAINLAQEKVEYDI
jgi:phosphoribosylformimino-5-aminoimidazole carboxamide ribotide isomerase